MNNTHSHMLEPVTGALRQTCVESFVSIPLTNLSIHFVRGMLWLSNGSAFWTRREEFQSLSLRERVRRSRKIMRSEEDGDEE